MPVSGTGVRTGAAGGRAGGSSPRCSYARAVATRPRGVRLQQPPLEQVGLVDVLDRVRLLADGHRERGQADRAAARTSGRSAPQDLAVEPVEARARRPRSISSAASAAALVDDAAAADLGEVAHALEQPVGDARGAAAARGRSPRRRPRRSRRRGCRPSGGRSARGRRRRSARAGAGCRSGRAAAWSAGRCGSSRRSA